ncbi:MAG: hypothetical protein AAF270_06875 [Pseudomonadota bacterium]
MKKRFQSYLNRVFQRPIVDQFQTPVRRRSVAIAVVAWQAITVCALMLLVHDYVAPFIVAAIIMVYLIGMLNMATRGTFELADEYLDEFQVRLRDAAYRKSYHFALIWLLLTAFVAGAFEGHEFQILYTLAFILLGFWWALSAPRLVVAWTSPADSADEE